MGAQTYYREAVEPAVATMFQSTSRPEQAIFHKEGEYWTIGCGGNEFRLKDTKGLGYIAHLLRHPAAEFHVLDLAGGIASQRDAGEMSQSGLPRGAEDLEKAGVHIGSLGDAGEMLDDQAKAAYRRRLSELREELVEAKELGNVERAEKAEHEIDALTSELSRAVGLRWTKSAGVVGFGTSPAEYRQDNQVGSGKDRAERRPARRYFLALHQNRQLLLVRARPRFPDCVEIRRGKYRAGEASNLNRRARCGA